jgi:hypothetical protein
MKQDDSVKAKIINFIVLLFTFDGNETVEIRTNTLECLTEQIANNLFEETISIDVLAIKNMCIDEGHLKYIDCWYDYAKVKISKK